MSVMRKLGFGVLGAGAVGLAGAAAVNRYGHRLRDRHDALLDDPLAPPTDVTHHRVPTADGGTLHVVDTGGGGRPVLLLHGDADAMVPFASMAEAAAALQAADFTVATHRMTGTGHGISPDGLGAALHFLRDQLA